jgi:hypothetical protein
MEFDLASPTGKLSKETPAEITVDGTLPLWSAGVQSRSRRRDEDQGRRDTPGFAGYQFGANDDERGVKTEQTSLEDLRRPTMTARPRSRSPRQGAGTTPSARAEVTVRLVESGGRAVERSIHAADRPSSTMIA